MNKAVSISGLLMLTGALWPITVAQASPPGEWEKFRTETRQRCVQALRKSSAVGPQDQLDVRVSPFGSESFGAALVAATTQGGTRRFVCVMDKRSKLTEIAEID
jgi:3-hydroxymyristoyl/3-hydroxydecanoyl-(acyl carrier protein) dehydratase